MTPPYDVIVLGAGTAGINAAHAAARADARVLLINDGPPVTACASKNCMPSKALLAATHVAHMARNAAPFGVFVPSPVIADFTSMVAQVKTQVRLFTGSVEDGVKQAVAQGRYDFINGRACFTPDGALAVNGRTLTAQRYVIATGSRPITPPIAGLTEVPYITSDDVLELEAAPSSLIIVGAGPVGLELAEVFARLSTEVLLVERSQLLDDFDPEFSAEFTRYFEAEPSLSLHTHAEVVQVRPGRQGSGITCVLEVDGRRHEHTAEQLLIAVGRAACLDGLGLEHLGLQPEQGRVEVNTAMQTANPRVFLAGDVVGPQILHIAAEQGRVAGHNAAVGSTEQTVDYAHQDLAIIFTSLTAARTGLTETQARQAEKDLVTASDNPARSGRGVTNKEAFGLWKLVVEAQTGKLLGAQILETEADASIHLVKMAMQAGFTVEDLSKMVAYHPTRAERLKGLADQICRRMGAPSAATICPQ